MTQARIPFDERGFLAEPRRWSKEMAAAIALRDGLEVLTPDHWEVIWTLRRYYHEHGTRPDFDAICAQARLEDHCIEHLFRTPEEAWRIAGLPDIPQTGPRAH